MNTTTAVSLVVSTALIGGAFLLVSPGYASKRGDAATPTATIVDGTQIIDISARGGYSPRVVMARAGVPTVVRVKTNGTFDCSASLIIPKLSYQKVLQPSGIEEIIIPAEQAQDTLQGLCSMGMYNFQIEFR